MSYRLQIQKRTWGIFEGKAKRKLGMEIDKGSHPDCVKLEDRSEREIRPATNHESFQFNLETHFWLLTE